MKTKLFLFSILMLFVTTLSVEARPYIGRDRGFNRGDYNRGDIEVGVRGDYRGGYRGDYQGDYRRLPGNNVQSLDVDGNGQYDEGEVDPNCEYQAGPCTCYCPVTTFKPQPYCTTRCVDEPYCVQRKCTRYVPQYYTKQFCRYVPQYYTKQFCRQVPECYYVPETKYRKKYIKEDHCRYIPCTTIKKTCIDVCPQSCPQPAAPVADCPCQ